jgi:hypothetical protein
MTELLRPGDGLARPNQASGGMLRGFSRRPARTPGIWSLASTRRIPGRGSFFDAAAWSEPVMSLRENCSPFARRPSHVAYPFPPELRLPRALAITQPKHRPAAQAGFTRSSTTASASWRVASASVRDFTRVMATTSPTGSSNCRDDLEPTGGSPASSMGSNRGRTQSDRSSLTHF